MTADTFKSKLSKLINKSRKAIRLYSTVSSPRSRGKEKPYADIQLEQWRETNEDLLNNLMQIIKNTNMRKAINDILIIRNRYADMVGKLDFKIKHFHKELVSSSVSSDFVKAAKVSGDLVPLKAKYDAVKAVAQELDDLLSYTTIKTPILPGSEDNEESGNLKVKSTKIIDFASKKKAIS